MFILQYCVDTPVDANYQYSPSEEALKVLTETSNDDANRSIVLGSITPLLS